MSDAVMERPTYRDLIDAPWMSGGLVVERRNTDVVLRKRHYPVAVALWSILVFGGIAIFIAGRASAAFTLSWMAAGACFLMFFVGFAVWMNRRPPILMGHLGGALILPAYERTLKAEHLHSMCFGPVVYCRAPHERIHGGCLYARLSRDAEPTPLYVDDCEGQVRRAAQRFAGALGVQFEILDKKEIGQPSAAGDAQSRAPAP